MCNSITIEFINWVAIFLLTLQIEPTLSAWVNSHSLHINNAKKHSLKHNVLIKNVHWNKKIMKIKEISKIFWDILFSNNEIDISSKNKMHENGC